MAKGIQLGYGNETTGLFVRGSNEYSSVVRQAENTKIRELNLQII